MNVREDFTIMEKAPWLKVSLLALSHLRQYSKQVLTHGKSKHEIGTGGLVSIDKFLKLPIPYDNCVGIPISRLNRVLNKKAVVGALNQ